MAGGPTYRELLAARRERQLVFGAGEVLLLVRQLLPVLAALHGQDLVHGDLSPANLLRRDRDGLPVLLDFGLVCDGSTEAPASGATPGYAPAELGRGEPVQPWMDLHALGVVALVLLTGEEPASLLDPTTLAWRWPSSDQLDPALRGQLERLLSPDPDQRFATASQALEAFQQLPMPESLGPVARADRTVVLVPPSVPSVEAAEPPAPAPLAAPLAAQPASAPPPAAVLRSRQQVKDEAVEGRLWPMVMALVISAVVGISLGWWLLGRGKAPSEEVREAPSAPSRPACRPVKSINARSCSIVCGPCRSTAAGSSTWWTPT